MKVDFTEIRTELSKKIVLYTQQVEIFLPDVLSFSNN